MKSSPKTKKKTKLDTVVDQLRTAILERKILPGEWLRQDELSERFSVSPTPIREALRRLEADGLVEYIPRHGVRVVPYSINLAQEYFDLRAMLEPYAVKLATDRITPDGLSELANLVDKSHELLIQREIKELSETHWEFHEKIIVMCGSNLVQGLLSRVRRSFQLDTLLLMPERAEDSWKEHKAVFEAIQSGDGFQAGELLRNNIENSRNAMLSRLPSLGVY